MALLLPHKPSHYSSHFVSQKLNSMSTTIREHLEQGPATSREIQAATGLKQGAVSRQLRSMGSSIVRLQSGRSVQYALTKNAFGGDDSLPLHQVDAYGNTVRVAMVRPLAHGGFLLEPSVGSSSILLGESQSGYYEDLPFFLSELGPQGFLGQQIAVELASRFEEFPPDPRLWTTSHIGRYLIANGDDLPGNLIFGAQSILRLRRKPVPSSREDYPKLADSVLRGDLAGSSAGGEQPKFTAFSEERSAHVIVKFSPQGDNAIARRWRDILITEYHATVAILGEGFPAAESSLLELGGRLFLESQRFDRSGEYGRLSMISLQAVDAEFVGMGSSWRGVLNELRKSDLISLEHVVNASVLWEFGRQINNSDMHLGNLSLGIEGSIFRLLPVYDMCSMGFAPKSGDVRPYEFTPPPMDYISSGPAVHVTRMVYSFWRRVLDDARISSEFRAFIENNGFAELLAIY